MENKISLNADSVNALFDAMGAICMAVSAALPPEQRERFAQTLAVAAKAAESRGATTLETALIDLRNAALLPR